MRTFCTFLPPLILLILMKIVKYPIPHHSPKISLTKSYKSALNVSLSIFISLLCLNLKTVQLNTYGFHYKVLVKGTARSFKNDFN